MEIKAGFSDVFKIFALVLEIKSPLIMIEEHENRHNYILYNTWQRSELMCHRERGYYQ